MAKRPKVRTVSFEHVFAYSNKLIFFSLGCSTTTFPKLLGKELSHQVLVGGKRLTTTDAFAVGFAKEVCPKDQALSAAVAFCTQLVNDPARKGAKRPVHLENGKEAATLREVNRRELDLCEKKWICHDSFSALSKFLFSRKSYFPGILLQ